VLPDAADKPAAVRTMFDRIAPRYDLLNRALTFGLDTRWRKRAVAALGLPSGSVVVDVASGTGDLCRDLSAAGMVPIGVDFSFGMLAAARTDAPLVQGDALRLPLATATVDGATSGFALRNFDALPPVFDELARVVRPRGRIALLDVAEPRNTILRRGHGIYFGRVVPLVGGLVSDKAAYRYLPESVVYLPPPDELVSTLEEAGFVDVRHQLLTGGISQLLTASRS
jgi:demethylmenaquinone methyltransferase/2-methoxy-6-polyprenyl-1,4-benzoquinol methylase